MLNRVLILRKIQVRRKRSFESVLSCQKEGTATWCPSAVAFSWLLFAWKVGESLFYLWCYSSFNGEGGGNVLSNLTFLPRRVHILICCYSFLGGRGGESLFL